MNEKGGGGSEEILGDSTDHQILLHFSIITYFYIKGTYIKSNENTPYLQVTFTQGFFSTSPSFFAFLLHSEMPNKFQSFIFLLYPIYSCFPFFNLWKDTIWAFWLFIQTLILVSTDFGVYLQWRS